MSLRVAVTFLTRVPLPIRTQSERDIARSLPWFPVVGAAVGALTAGVYVVLLLVVTSWVAAVVAVACATFVTGAFHEDGLADTADALGGSFDREQALRIFKDPTHGTFGVAALVLGFGLRIAAIASMGPLLALAVLPAAHALSRAAAVQLLEHLPSGAPGLGATYSDAASRSTIRSAALAGVVLAAIFSGPATAAYVIASAIVVVWLGRMARRKIGGVNGDVLGATQQLAELAILVVGLALAGTASDPVWWS